MQSDLVNIYSHHTSGKASKRIVLLVEQSLKSDPKIFGVLKGESIKDVALWINQIPSGNTLLQFDIKESPSFERVAKKVFGSLYESKIKQTGTLNFTARDSDNRINLIQKLWGVVIGSYYKKLMKLEKKMDVIFNYENDQHLFKRKLYPSIVKYTIEENTNFSTNIGHGVAIESHIEKILHECLFDFNRETGIVSMNTEIAKTVLPIYARKVGATTVEPPPMTIEPPKTEPKQIPPKTESWHKIPPRIEDVSIDFIKKVYSLPKEVDEKKEKLVKVYQMVNDMNRNFNLQIASLWKMFVDEMKMEKSELVKIKASYTGMIESYKDIKNLSDLLGDKMQIHTWTNFVWIKVMEEIKLDVMKRKLGEEAYEKSLGYMTDGYFMQTIGEIYASNTFQEVVVAFIEKYNKVDQPEPKLEGKEEEEEEGEEEESLEDRIYKDKLFSVPFDKQFDVTLSIVAYYLDMAVQSKRIDNRSANLATKLLVTFGDNIKLKLEHVENLGKIKVEANEGEAPMPEEPSKLGMWDSWMRSIEPMFSFLYKKREGMREEFKKNLASGVSNSLFSLAAIIIVLLFGYETALIYFNNQQSSWKSVRTAAKDLRRMSNNITRDYMEAEWTDPNGNKVPIYDNESKKVNFHAYKMSLLEKAEGLQKQVAEKETLLQKQLQELDRQARLAITQVSSLKKTVNRYLYNMEQINKYEEQAKKIGFDPSAPPKILPTSNLDTEAKEGLKEFVKNGKSIGFDFKTMFSELFDVDPSGNWKNYWDYVMRETMIDHRAEDPTKEEFVSDFKHVTKTFFQANVGKENYLKLENKSECNLDCVAGYAYRMRSYLGWEKRLNSLEESLMVLSYSSNFKKELLQDYGENINSSIKVGQGLIETVKVQMEDIQNRFEAYKGNLLELQKLAKLKAETIDIITNLNTTDPTVARSHEEVKDLLDRQANMHVHNVGTAASINSSRRRFMNTTELFSIWLQEFFEKYNPGWVAHSLRFLSQLCLSLIGAKQLQHIENMMSVIWMYWNQAGNIQLNGVSVVAGFITNVMLSFTLVVSTLAWAPYLKATVVGAQMFGFIFDTMAEKLKAWSGDFIKEMAPEEVRVKKTDPETGKIYFEIEKEIPKEDYRMYEIYRATNLNKKRNIWGYLSVAMHWFAQLLYSLSWVLLWIHNAMSTILLIVTIILLSLLWFSYLLSLFLSIISTFVFKLAYDAGSLTSWMDWLFKGVVSAAAVSGSYAMIVGFLRMFISRQVIVQASASTIWKIVIGIYRLLAAFPTVLSTMVATWTVSAIVSMSEAHNNLRFIRSLPIPNWFREEKTKGMEMTPEEEAQIKSKSMSPLLYICGSVLWGFIYNWLMYNLSEFSPVEFVNYVFNLGRGAADVKKEEEHKGPRVWKTEGDEEELEVETEQKQVEIRDGGYLVTTHDKQVEHQHEIKHPIPQNSTMPKEFQEDTFLRSLWDVVYNNEANHLATLLNRTIVTTPIIPIKRFDQQMWILWKAVYDEGQAATSALMSNPKLAEMAKEVTSIQEASLLNFETLSLNMVNIVGDTNLLEEMEEAIEME